jgi:hypothetical protein
MHAREHERRVEAAPPRRRHVERHPSGRQRLQARCEPRQLAHGHAGARAPGVHETAVRGIIGEQQRAQVRAAALRGRSSPR